MIKSRDVTIFESELEDLRGQHWFCLRDAEQAELKCKLKKYLFACIDTKHLTPDEVIEEAVDRLVEAYHITMKAEAPQIRSNK